MSSGYTFYLHVMIASVQVDMMASVSTMQNFPTQILGCSHYYPRHWSTDHVMGVAMPSATSILLLDEQPSARCVGVIVFADTSK